MKVKIFCLECVGIIFDDVVGDVIGVLDFMICWERGDMFLDLFYFSLLVKNGCSFCVFFCYLFWE